MHDAIGKVTRKAEVVELSSSDDEDSPNPGPSEPLPSCPICLTDILDPLEKAVTGCMHTFCRSCLAEWLRVKRFCPLCKRRILTYVTHIRDDATFTEVDVPPSPVHDYPQQQQQNRHQHNNPQRQPNDHHHYHEWYRAYFQHHHYHHHYQHQHQHRGQVIRGDGLHSGLDVQHGTRVDSQQEELHPSRGDSWAGQMAAGYRQPASRSSDTEQGDLLRQLHRIADRLAETDASYDSDTTRRQPPGAPISFRREGTSAAAEAIGGLDRDGGEGERERERWRVTVLPPRSQQQQQQQQRQRGTAAMGVTPARETPRQPRPYFFRLQQRLAATAAATNSGAAGVERGRQDPWAAAAAAAASFMAAAPPPPPPRPAPAAAPAHANVVLQQLPAAAAVDEHAAAVAIRRRIYDVGLWAVGLRGGGGPSGRNAGAASGSPAGSVRGGHLPVAGVAAAASRAEERRHQLELWVGRDLQALLGATDLSLLRALVVSLVDRFGVDRDWSAELEQRTTAVQTCPIPTSAAATTGEDYQAAAAAAAVVVGAAASSGPHVVVSDSRQQLVLPRRHRQHRQQQQLPGAVVGGAGAAVAAAEDGGGGGGPLASLRPFLLERTSHFWHEIRHFVLSGLTVQVYDARVEYRYHGSVGGGSGAGGGSVGGGGDVPSESPVAASHRPRVTRYHPPLRRPRIAGAPLALAAPSLASVAVPLPTRTAVMSSSSVAPASLHSLAAGGQGAPLQPPPPPLLPQQNQATRLQLRRPADAEAGTGAAVRRIEVVDLTLLDSSSTGSDSSEPAGGIHDDDDDDGDVEPEVVGQWRLGDTSLVHGDEAGAAAVRTGGGGGRGSGGGGAEAAANGVLTGERTRPSLSRWDASVVCPGFTNEAAVHMAEAVGDATTGRPAKRRRRWDERPEPAVLAHPRGAASEAVLPPGGTQRPGATEPVLAAHGGAVAAAEAAAARVADRAAVDEAIGAATATVVECGTEVPTGGPREGNPGVVPGAAAAALARDVVCNDGVHMPVAQRQDGDGLREGGCARDSGRGWKRSRRRHSDTGRSGSRRRSSHSRGRSESRERHKQRRHHRREHERLGDGSDGDGLGRTQPFSSHHHRRHYHQDYQHHQSRTDRRREDVPHNHRDRHSRHRQLPRWRRCHSRSSDDRHLERGIRFPPHAEEADTNGDDRWQLEAPGELILPVL